MAFLSDTAIPHPAHPLGDLAIWFIILAELLVFGVFLLAYALTPHAHSELFNTYKLTLDLGSGGTGLKAQLVAEYFVGLRRVSGFWRPLIAMYLLVLGLGIALAFDLVE